MKPVLLIFMIILAIDMSPFGSPSHAEANSSSDIERHKKDIESYKLELETSPDSGEIRKKLAAYYLTAARVMIDRGRYEEALHLLDEGEKYQREERKLKFLRGLAYFRMKSYFEAESELVSIAYEGNGYPEALKLLGWLYYDMANLRGAIDVWRQALDLEPGDGQLENLIAKTRKEYLHEESLSTGFTGRFLLQYDGERDEATGEKVLEILEDAYQDVGSDLNHYPEGDIVVILYTNREFKDITMAPEWVGGIYDGKIRLPVGGIKGPARLLRPLLYHEYAHVVINSATKGNCPAWLHEGLAVFEEESSTPHPREDLARPVKKEEVIPLGDLESSFLSFKGDGARRAYRQSYSFVKYLIDNYGISRLSELLLQLSRGKGINDAVVNAYSDHGKSLEVLFKEWRDSQT